MAAVKPENAQHVYPSFQTTWEHSDPRVRRKAFESGDVPAEAVLMAACSDSDSAVRHVSVG